MVDVTTLDDIENTKSRRSWLKGLGVLTSITGIGWFLFGDVDARPQALSVAIDPNIDRLEVADGILKVEFAEDTAGDEWAIMHEYHRDSSDAFATGKIPEFGGAVEIPIRSHVSQASVDFPTNRFEIVVYELDLDERDRIVPTRLSGVEFEL